MLPGELNVNRDIFFSGVNSYASVVGVETGIHTTDYYNKEISNVFFVKEYSIKESFCKLYEMEIVLESSFLNYATENFSFTFDASTYVDFLNKKICLTTLIQNSPNKLDPKNHQRTISGLITDFDYEYIFDYNKKIDTNIIKLKVKPLISEMDFLKKNYIFTNSESADKSLTIKDLFDILFKKYKVKTQFNFENLNIDKRKNPFKIQYQETDFEFFVRVCQENNLYFYSTYDNNGDELLIISDIKSAKLKSIETFEIIYEKSNFTQENSFKQLIYPHFKSGLQSKNCEPHLQWPLQWPQGNMVLQTSYLRKMIFPGNIISLENSDSKVDQMFVVSSTTHLIVDSNNKQRISHEILFYPMSLGICLMAQIQKPKILGCQYALVVGQSDGDETCSINDTTPKGGTVRVQLYLENWPAGSRVYSLPLLPPDPIALNIPVAQPFGGQSGQKGYCGVWMMPRVGQTVLIEFYNGDPDQPVITGTVYNSQNTNNSWVPGGKNLIPTYTTYDANANPVAAELTAKQFAMVTCTTPSGKTGNVFLLDDKEDENDPQIYMSTNGNSSFVSLNNTSITVLKGNYVTQVGTGDLKSTMTFDNKGNLTINVPGNMSFKAEKDVTFDCENFNLNTKKNANITTTQDTSITASQNVGITASQNIKMNSKSGSTSIQSGAKMDIKGGTSVALNGAMSANISSPQVTLKADAQMTIEGALVNMKGDGPTAIKGAIIQAN